VEEDHSFEEATKSSGPSLLNGAFGRSSPTSLTTTAMPWSKEKEAELLKLFKDGKAPYQTDANGKIAAKDIARVWDDNMIFHTNYTKRLFYQIYRRKAAEFLTNKAKTGARSKCC
jgi:hypothetical protein